MAGRLPPYHEPYNPNACTRDQRHSKRNLTRIKGRSGCSDHSDHSNIVCTICHETLDDTPVELLTTTVCDHVYHRTCWHEYAKHCAQTAFDKMDLVLGSARANGRNTLTPQETAVCYSLHLDSFAASYAGPPCPLCKTAYPIVHEFAKRVATNEFCRKWEVHFHFPSDIPLRMAENR